MQNLKTLIDTVQSNCHISDARHAGNYSLCVFLLKMREFYRWERRIPLTQQLVREKVGDWMAQREKDWAQLENDGYAQLPLAEQHYDPFAAEAVNASLVPMGYVYSSGYGVFHKPHFFLGELHSTRVIDGCNVYIASRELARDLVAPPAMAINQDIFIRQESLRRFIWEKIEEWQWKQHPDTPMGRIMQNHDQQADPESLLDALVQQETETLVLHELGEMRAGTLIGAQWHALLAAATTSKDEFVLRAIRDLVADCHVTLPSLLRDENHDALHFFFGNFTGLRRALYPQLQQAYEQAVKSRELTVINDTVQHGQELWLQHALALVDIFKTDVNRLPAELEKLGQSHKIQ